MDILAGKRSVIRGGKVYKIVLAEEFGNRILVDETLKIVVKDTATARFLNGGYLTGHDFVVTDAIRDPPTQKTTRPLTIDELKTQAIGKAFKGKNTGDIIPWMHIDKDGILVDGSWLSPELLRMAYTWNDGTEIEVTE